MRSAGVALSFLVATAPEIYAQSAETHLSLIQTRVGDYIDEEEDLITMSHVTNFENTGELEAEDDGHETKPIVDEKDRPRMIAMEGCAGSTFLVHIARDILEKHGFDVAFKENPSMIEMIKTKNLFFKPDKPMSAAIGASIDHARKQNKTLVFKATHMDDATARELINVGTYPLAGWRDNVLDTAECYVRDCFEEGLGKAIDQHGKESQLCLHRRQAPKSQTEGVKVQFNIPELLEFVKKVSSRHFKYPGELIEAGFAKSVPTVSYEELVAYEYSKDPAALKTSIGAWETVLTVWGIVPDTKIIGALLSPAAGTRENATHQDTLYNYQAVKEAMTEAGYGWMVRGA